MFYKPTFDTLHNKHLLKELSKKLKLINLVFPKYWWLILLILLSAVFIFYSP